MSRSQNNFAKWVIVLVIGMIISSNLPVFGEPLILTKKSMNENSPLKQFKSGIKAEDIQCKDDFQLVIKEENNFPACVKPSTASKLVLLGWAKLKNDVGTSHEEPSTKTITLDDNEKSITLKEGESFLLKLGENFNWTIDIDDPTVVSRQINIMVVRGAQGVYNAHHAGTATLTGVGDPLCLTDKTPCKIHSIPFTLKIIVTSASGDDPSMHTAPVNDYESLIKALDEHGVKFEFVEELEDSSFSVPTKVVSVNGENIQVFEFSSKTDAQNAAGLVSDDGTQIGTSMIRWIDTPHFYKQDKIIVLYVGHTQEMLNLLDSLLDKQFAGM